jgi:fructose-1,6-bisphosphatase/inositol monophosphatase family enzyme
MDLNELLEVAKLAALRAHDIIGNNEGKTFAVNIKESEKSIQAQVVTEIDLAADKAISEALASSRDKYNIGLLTEESVDDSSRFECDYFWCVDPLDGTYFYSSGQDGYATSIALVSKKGEAILGVVNCPRTNDLYYAIKGQGAFKNDNLLKISNKNSSVTIVDDKSAGAVMNCLKTIECAPAIYAKAPKESQGGGSLWDFAACSIIQSESGGVNGDYTGRPLNLNRANTYLNHCGVCFASSAELVENIKEVLNE